MKLEEIQKPKENFNTFVELNKPMTVREAVQVLAEFHGVSEENVLAAFMNLKNDVDKEGYTATFYKTLNQSADAMGVEVKDEKNNWVSNSKIDQYTGQPMQHAS